MENNRLNKLWRSVGEATTNRCGDLDRLPDGQSGKRKGSSNIGNVCPGSTSASPKMPSQAPPNACNYRDPRPNTKANNHCSCNVSCRRASPCSWINWFWLSCCMPWGPAPKIIAAPCPIELKICLELTQRNSSLQLKPDEAPSWRTSRKDVMPLRQKQLDFNICSSHNECFDLK